jgi:hypothetical protein
LPACDAFILTVSEQTKREDVSKMIRLPFSSVISFPYFRPFAAAFVGLTVRTHNLEFYT